MNFDFSKIDYNQMPNIAKTDLAFLSGDKSLDNFQSYSFDFESFDEIIQEKSLVDFPREILVQELLEQHKSFKNNELTLQNINSLTDKNTFTVITAHQPILFGGPGFSIYKIASVINVCKQLKAKYPAFHFVPVYVMGSEDHDFEELNNTTVFGKKLVWENPDASGSVGRLSPHSIGSLVDQLTEILGENEKTAATISMYKTAYENSSTFAASTQYIMHEIFHSWGLVVANLDNKKLKSTFIPVIKKEVLSQFSVNFVNNDIQKLNELGFKNQANPREINFFYLIDNKRERIVFNENDFEVLNTNIRFTKEEMEQEIENFPDRFSPNVVMRPIYQEFVFPNLAYIGGGGEMAYWMERKSLFEALGRKMPMLIRRNSWLFIENSIASKMEKLNLPISFFFQESDVLLKKYIEDFTDEEVSVSQELVELKAIFDKLVQKSNQIDQTLEKSIWAEHVKQEKSIEQIAFKLQKAAKQKYENQLNQVMNIKTKLFPNQSWQERVDSFIPFYTKWGEKWVEYVIENGNPFDKKFNLIVEKN